MAKVDIWMPIYIGDYLADTGRLTTEMHGAYFLLMMDYWRSGALPDNDEVLASVTKMSLEQWKKVRPILAAFFDIRDGLWVHGRIEKEILAANNRRLAAQKNGKKGGRPKTQEKPIGKPPGKPTGKPIGKPTENLRGNPQKTSSPSPSPSPTQGISLSKEENYSDISSTEIGGEFSPWGAAG